MSDTTATTDDAAAEAEAPSEIDELRQGLLDSLTEGLGEAVVGSHIAPGRELWVRVQRDAWSDAAELARTKLGCTFFDFLSALDWMPSPWGRYEYSVLDSGLKQFDANAPIAPGVAGGDTRFQVFMRLANVHKAGVSVIVKADLPDDDQRIASLVPIFSGANWHERECWEMFGITFDGHPGLRHLYLPGAFEGHPLRKDFPLLARLVKPWPGIVDVEPMPADADPEARANGEGESESGASAADAAETHGESRAEGEGTGSDRGGEGE